MTARGPTSFDSKSLIGVLLILVAGVTLPGGTADAEECLAAPNSCKLALPLTVAGRGWPAYG